MIVNVKSIIINKIEDFINKSINRLVFGVKYDKIDTFLNSKNICNDYYFTLSKDLPFIEEIIKELNKDDLLNITNTKDGYMIKLNEIGTSKKESIGF